MGIDEKKLLEEVEKHRKALKKDPSSKEFLPLAEALRKLKRYDEAIEVCRAGISKNPKYWTAYIALIKIYMDAGKIEEGIKEAENLLRSVPDNATVWRLKGEAELRIGDKASALRSFERCYELSPDEPGLEDLIKTLRAELEEVKEAEEKETAEKGQKSAEEESIEDIAPSPEEKAESTKEREEMMEEVKETAEEERIEEGMEEFQLEEAIEKEHAMEEVKEEVMGVERPVEEKGESLPVYEEPEMEEKKEVSSPEVGVPSPEPPVVVKDIKKVFDVREAVEFALIMEREGNIKAALQLWTDVLKHEPGHPEARKKVAELRAKMWEEKKKKMESSPEMADNLKRLARWIKKIKEGG